MTIAKKLVVLIMMMVAGVSLLSGIAIDEMHTLKNDIYMLNTNLFPSVVKINQVATNFADLRTQVLRHILSGSADDMQNLETAIAQMRHSIEDDLNYYLDNLIYNNKDRDLLLDEQTKVREYFVLLDETLLLAKQHQAAKALEKVTAARSRIDLVSMAFQAHAAYNLELANDFASNAESIAHRGLWMIVSIALLAIALGCIVGRTLYRQIIGALGTLQNGMSEIAATLDFRKRVAMHSRDEITATACAFNTLQDKVQNSLQQMQKHANRIGSTSAQLAAAANRVSAGSGEQSEASSGVAAAVEELTVSINHVSDRAGEASQLAVDAGQVARDSATVIAQTLSDIRQIDRAVREAAGTVGRLNEGSSKVNAVITVIKEVAEQTNLLALNAAIEAARAGEQGRGFAVVADEVRKLAERTARSTQEISAMILTMQNDANNAVKGITSAVTQVEQGVEHTQAAEKAVREIEASTGQTVAIVGEIADAIREQSTASSVIAQEIERLAQMTEENNAAAHSVAESAASLDQVAVSMRSEVERYHL